MRKVRRPFYLLISYATPFCGRAQGLNAHITVNGDRTAIANKQIFTTLQNSLTEFVNNRKWMGVTFIVSEKVDCTMTIIVNELDEASFKNEIQIQARRLVYNSGYTTTLLNLQDQQLDFEYTEEEPLDYNSSTLTSNFTATIMFYAYMILGLDFDSSAPRDGTIYMQQAQQIVGTAQFEMSWTGWRAFDNNQNRYAVATALQDNAPDTLREMWYTHHRKGLDEVAADPGRGHMVIIGALPVLQEVKKTRSTSVLLQMFAGAKLDEIIVIYSEATTQEQQEDHKVLFEIYPTQSTHLEELQKPVR